MEPECGVEAPCLRVRSAGLQRDHGQVALLRPPADSLDERSSDAPSLDASVDCQLTYVRVPDPRPVLSPAHADEADDRRILLGNQQSDFRVVERLVDPRRHGCSDRGWIAPWRYAFRETRRQRQECFPIR